MHLNLLDTVQGTLFKNISQEPNIFRTLFSIKNLKNGNQHPKNIWFRGC